MLKRHKLQKRDKRKMQGMINERWQKLMKDKDFLIHTNFLQTKEKNDLAREHHQEVIHYLSWNDCTNAPKSSQNFFDTNFLGNSLHCIF